MTQFLALLRLQLLSRYADLKPKNLKSALTPVHLFRCISVHH